MVMEQEAQNIPELTAASFPKPDADLARMLSTPVIGHNILPQQRVFLEQTGYIQGLNTEFVTPIDHAEIFRRTRRAYYQKKWPFKSLTELYDVGRHQGEFAVVGAGPSVLNDMEEIRAMSEPGSGVVIVTLNNAHDLLLEHNIKPDLAVLIEARDRAADYIKPEYGIGYLIGTQVSDVTLERFLPVADQVHLFHVMVSEKHRQQIRKLNNAFSKINIPGVTGATSVGLRFYDLLTAFIHPGTTHFFGMDSSGSQEAMHAKQKNFGAVQGTMPVKLMRPDGRTFSHTYWTDSGMLLQAGQFWQITEQRAASIRRGHIHPFKIAFHGRGLLPDWAACHGFHVNGAEILAELEAEGLEDAPAPNLSIPQITFGSRALSPGVITTQSFPAAEEAARAEAQPNDGRELGEPKPDAVA